MEDLKNILQTSRGGVGTRIYIVSCMLLKPSPHYYQLCWIVEEPGSNFEES